jgi:hypothetical protein
MRLRSLAHLNGVAASLTREAHQRFPMIHIGVSRLCATGINALWPLPVTAWNFCGDSLLSWLGAR